MNCQEKLDILVDSFRKLDENRKDHIRELTRKLAEIHMETDIWSEFSGENGTHSENLGIYTA